MDQHELDMIEKHAASNPEVKSLWEDHVLYSKQVDKLEGKPFRTPMEEQTLKQLKKQKLEVKTQLIDMLERLK
ncbi:MULTISPECIES: YdcH family protein [unclassified Desulfovibrio]|uniref:YdcH family protein n=1 Tax=unclassified Desulfovibrio TaxID=2593640 RepID=UPI000F5DCE2F|nr:MULTISPECIES: YdcH family protein [unclassified Desulfovibrio]RRD70217.1 DUF465 domain-containing protein [Desulfovibrio sp. OH1209_COT-279]RRD86739.1 DUF465 domain-containing protein [Desulfovibrio sp. OH1186_COT-070]